MNVRSFNIVSYPRYKVNFWGIPKCGSTSVKIALSDQQHLPSVLEDRGIEHFHKKRYHNYIFPFEALSNGFENISFIKHPYLRMISIYKDFGVKRSNTSLDINTWIQENINYEHNMFNSISWFLSRDEKILCDNVMNVSEINSYMKKHNVIVSRYNTHDGDFELSDHSKDLIKLKYQQDFKLFVDLF